MSLWQRLRRLGFELYCFFTAPFVVKNCLSMFGVVAGLFLLTFWWLKCYTNHGESLQVPSYKGMAFQDAARKARSRNFGVAISDSIYEPGRVPGEVLDQNPKPESRVKEGRTIYFTIAKNNPDIVRLPPLAGSDDYDLYARKIARLGLKPRVAARVGDPRLEPNTIVHVLYRGDTITSKIRSGFMVEVGGTVDFVVSEAVTLTISIPDCVCQTYDAAKFLLQSSNLNVGSVMADGTVTDREHAFVLRQMPAFDPNGTMRVGEQVDLWLTQQRPQKCGGEE